MTERPPWLSLDEAARRVRTLLKGRFNKVRFSVRQRHGNCIDISWTDGPTVEAVEGLVGAYRSGRFDSMTDCASTVDIACPVYGQTYRGGARFMSYRRSYTPDAVASALRYQIDRWSDPDILRVLSESEVRTTEVSGAYVHHPTDYRPAQLVHQTLGDRNLCPPVSY